jgi:hypothetical protein
MRNNFIKKIIYKGVKMEKQYVLGIALLLIGILVFSIIIHSNANNALSIAKDAKMQFDSKLNGSTVSIGTNAGLNQGEESIAIGNNAGKINQGDATVALGPLAGYQNQSIRGISIGLYAGYGTQGDSAMALGSSAGNINQGANAIAIGSNAGAESQGIKSIAIGNNTASQNQGSNAIAIGEEAGHTSQGIRSIGLGFLSGRSNQGATSIAIGNAAGSINQGVNAIAIGNNAGYSNQKEDSVAIGLHAGKYADRNTIVIGKDAGSTSSSVVPQGSIVIGTGFDNTTAYGSQPNSLFINPVRAVANNLGLRQMYYNPMTSEVVYYAP